MKQVNAFLKTIFEREGKNVFGGEKSLYDSSFADLFGDFDNIVSNGFTNLSIEQV